MEINPMQEGEPTSKLNCCGAKTRNGKPCANSRMRGKQRCRMHGGAKGNGAPKGSQNALKHGMTTREAKANRKDARQVRREAEALLEEYDRLFRS